MNCRIIDIHTHIYPVALARRAMEVTGHENDDFKKLPIRENLLARMREAGVDLSVNLPVVSKPQNQGEVNRFAKEAARKNIISFGGLHPDCENVIEELEKLLVPCADIQECIVKEKDKKICALIYCDPAKQETVKEFVTGVNRGLPLYKRMVTEFSAQPLPRNAMGKLLR